MEQPETVPLVPDPSPGRHLVAEARVLLHRATLAERSFTPHAAIRVVVLERSAIARLEAFFGEQRRPVAPRTGDEMDLALLAGLDVAQARILVLAGDEPVAGKQVACGHASSEEEGMRDRAPRTSCCVGPSTVTPRQTG